MESKKVNVDTAVRGTAVRHPAAARRHERVREWIKAIRARNEKLRQCYRQNSKKTFCRQVGYAMGRQLKKRLSYFLLVLKEMKKRNADYKLEDLHSLLENHPGAKRIFVQTFVMEYNYIMQQRPQHLAKAMAKAGFLVFYMDNSPDWKPGFTQVGENIFIVSGVDWNWPLSLENAVILTYLNTSFPLEWLETAGRDKSRIYIFEYVDKFDPKIHGRQYDEFTNNLRRALKNPDIYFTATASALYEDIIRKGGDRERVCLLTNAVDIFHFDRQAIRKSNNILRKKPDDVIIGYFGAIASWLNFELIRRLAETYPEYKFVFAGVCYNGGSKLLPELDNIIYLGPLDYLLLPNIASEFDVGIIPFEPGEIARCTSPLKLFEYFAMGIPVVVTEDMLECRRYPEVLAGENIDSFISQIPVALKKASEPEFRHRLRELAVRNSWSLRAQSLTDFILKHSNRSEACCE
ncbi:MAG: hypothetical protein PHV82_15080 [Victivallaceae bacterium]|nr:hypothetical protein [Victivallaceae bacterium]